MDIHTDNNLGAQIRSKQHSRNNLEDHQKEGAAMFNSNPFQQPGQWYRGNTHSHSTESDGQLSVGDRFAAYRDAGLRFPRANRPPQG